MAAVDSYTTIFDCSGPGGIPLLSKTKISIVALTAANFTAQTGLLNAFQAAIEPLTDGVLKSTSVAIDKAVNTGYPSGVANRGSKWIIAAVNAAQQAYTYTIPAGPGTGELNPDNITADLTGTNWAAFKTAFEAVATDRAGGALTIVSAKLGGRRR
jgi:hypothetical protein